MSSVAKALLIPLCCLVLSACAGPPASTDSATSDKGWVIVEFEIDPEGATRNIVVLESNPPGVFGSEATKAVATWRYKPAVVDGKAVSSKKRVRIEFELDR